MSSEDDLFDDILPMVLFGVLDPKYLTGKKKGLPKNEEEDESDKEKDKE